MQIEKLKNEIQENEKSINNNKKFVKESKKKITNIEKKIKSLTEQNELTDELSKNINQDMYRISKKECENEHVFEQIMENKIKLRDEKKKKLSTLFKNITEIK